MSAGSVRPHRRAMAPGRIVISALFPVYLLAAAAGFAEAFAAGATVPEARSDPTKATSPGAVAAEQGTSPWEHELWTGATTMMRIYVCSHARRRPSWCQDEQELPSKSPLPDEQGPPLTAEDADWLRFLEQADPGNLSPQDVAVITRRANDRRDPQAMEILGFLYAQGGPVERDYAEAYRWYGRAYLAGQRDVRANMEIVWGLLQRHDLEAALALTREFNALSKGEPPPVSQGAQGAGASSASGGNPAAAVADPTGL